MIVPLSSAEILEDIPRSDETLSLKKARKLYNMCMDTSMYNYICKNKSIKTSTFQNLNVENLKERKE